MIRRYLKQNIIKDLNKKMVFVGGPRQVGKTTFAKKLLDEWEPEQTQKDQRYLSWDDPHDREILLDEAYVAEVPELPGCATHGKTYEEAVRNAQDAIETWISGARQSHYPVPEPLAHKQFSGKFVTRIDPDLHRNLAMKAKESGKTLNGLVQEIIEKGI